MIKHKSTAKMNVFSEQNATLFKDVVFLVEATHTEQHMLWEQYHYRSKPGTPLIKDWKQVSMSHSITIGTVDNRPIVVNISYAILNGKKVIFYEGVSQLVDHQMIKDWIKMYSLKTIRYDGNTRWAHCDAMNFNHCMNAIGVFKDYADEKIKAGKS